MLSPKIYFTKYNLNKLTIKIKMICIRLLSYGLRLYFYKKEIDRFNRLRFSSNKTKREKNHL